jgi:hypothetical protein
MVRSSGEMASRSITDARDRGVMAFWAHAMGFDSLVFHGMGCGGDELRG